MKMKKLLSLSLAAAITLSAFATQVSAQVQAPVAPVQVASASKPKELNVMRWARDVADFANMEFFKSLAEKTNINAQLDVVNGGDWSTKTNLMLASGEYPDIIMRGGVDIEMFGVDQGILMPVDELIEPYMPNYKARLEYDPNMADLLRASDVKMYHFGYLVPQNINVSSHLFVNKSWLDNVGMESPTTVQEYEDMLVAFRDEDPNGNGEQDEIAFSGTRSSSVDGMLWSLSFWGIPYDPGLHWLMIDDDNKVTSQLLHPNMRDAMTTLNKWYTDGLIDIESVTQATAEFEAKVNSGILGSFWRWRMLAMGTEDSVVEQYESIIPVAAPDVTPQVPVFLETPGFGAALTINCDDVEAACTWLDAQFEPEMIFDAYHGKYETVKVNGVDTVCGWTYGENGKVDFYYTPLETTPNQSSMYFFSGEEYFSMVNLPIQRVEKIEYCEAYTEAGVVEKNISSVLTNICKYTIDEIAQRDMLRAEIEKFADEAIIGFITNGVTDASWDTYTETLENLRIDEYIELTQNVYDRYLESAE
jgi:putative aldouronate transport system substrate-binding protein